MALPSGGSALLRALASRRERGRGWRPRGACAKLSIETTGPYLCTKKGKKFIDPKGREYTAKKDVYYIHVRRRSSRRSTIKLAFAVCEGKGG